MTYRVLLTGSRTWVRRHLLWGVLDEIRAEHPDMVLVHGACPKGADYFADTWALMREVECERHPADWDRYGRRAGFTRNAQMAISRPDECVAFIRDESRGATHCADLAESHNVPTRRWTE